MVPATHAAAEIEIEEVAGLLFQREAELSELLAEVGAGINVLGVLVKIGIAAAVAAGIPAVEEVHFARLLPAS